MRAPLRSSANGASNWPRSTERGRRSWQISSELEDGQRSRCSGREGETPGKNYYSFHSVHYLIQTSYASDKDPQYAPYRNIALCTVKYFILSFLPSFFCNA